MATSKNICAVIEAQGFAFGQVFYVKELAVYNDELILSLELTSRRR